MIAIVDDEELWKEKGISNTAKYTNKDIVGRPCLVWMHLGSGTQRFDEFIGDSETIPQVNLEILNIKPSSDFQFVEYSRELCDK